MRRLSRWFAQRHHRRMATAAEASPLPGDTPALWRVLSEKRRFRETEGRHLFQELERRRAANVTPSARTAPVVPAVPAAQMALAAAATPPAQPVVSSTFTPRRSARRRPRLARPTFPALPARLRKSIAGLAPSPWRRWRPRPTFPALPARLRNRRVLVSIALVVVVLAVVSGVVAFFVAGSTAGSYGAAQAGALPTGNTPGTPSVSSRDVTITWAQNSPAFLGGRLGADANGGYLIKRYAESGGDSITPGASCSGLQQGGTASLSCTENGLPTGRWQYTVTPKYYNWLGVESPHSASAVIAPEAPTSVTLTNGLGQSNAYINGSNKGSINVDVALPATSLSSDTIHLTVSDGTPAHDVTASANPSADGATTVSFTGLDLSGLDDGSLTFKAKATSSYGDDSGNTSHSYTKDSVNPVVNVTASRPADSGGWYNHSVTFSASTSTDTGGSGIQSCDPDVVYSGPDTSNGSLTFFCTDKAANSASNSISFKYDATKPSSSASGNDSNWHNSPVTVHLSATDPNGSNGSGVAHITYTVDAGSPQTISGDAGDVVIADPSDHSNDGQHTIAFYASDNAANDETPSNSVTVKIDTTKPVTTPAGADSSWHNAPVTVHLASSDPGYPTTGSGVVNLHYQVDANAAVDVPGASGVASTDVVIPAPANGSNDGQHTITYHATDGASNAEVAGSVTVKIDTQKPTTTIAIIPASPTGSAGWYKGPTAPTFTLGATDPAPSSGIANSFYKIDSGSTQTYSGAVSIPEGSHTITYWSADNATNTEANNTTSTIKVDTVDPTGSITNPPTGNVSGTVSLRSADASDATSGVATVSYSYCAGTSCTPSISIGSSSSGPNYQVNWDTTQLANGSYRLRAAITDAAGNTSTTSIVDVTISNTYTFTVTNPGTQTAGVAFGPSVTLQLQVNGSNTTKFNGVTYSGAKTITFTGPGNSPAPTNAPPTYPASVTFASGAATLPASSVTLRDAETTTLTATDSTGSPTIVGTSASFTVNAATAANLLLAAATTSPNAGAADNLTITARDAFSNTATGYTGSKNLIFGGAGSVDGNNPTVTNSSGTAINFGSTTAITFTSGVASVTGSNNGVMKLFKAETASITVADTTPISNGAGLSVTVSAGAAAGIILSNITTAPTPALTCTGPVGTLACSSTGESNTGGPLLTAKLTLVDQFQNVLTNTTGSTITIDLATSGDGSVSPTGLNALSILNGTTTTSASFTLTRSNGNNKTVVMTATVHGTTQKLTVTLSS